MIKKNLHIRVAIAIVFGLSIALMSCKKEEELSVIVKTYQAVEIGGETVTIEGEVFSNGVTVSKRGVCISTKSNPTLVDGCMFSSSQADRFSVVVSPLVTNTTYYYRAFVMIGSQVVYGNPLTITTTLIAPVIDSTIQVTNITGSSAQTGGRILRSGGAPVTARGVCWSENPAPTIANDKTVNGAGTGAYTSNINGLNPATTYHVRAYATNSEGTSYGNELVFTTLDGRPILRTNAVTEIVSSGARLNAEIQSNGESAVTNRGFCWGIVSNPTIENNSIDLGYGLAAFNTIVTGLGAGTTYYVKAWAENGYGLSYGNEVVFETRDGVISLSTINATQITGTSAQSGGTITDDGGTSVLSRGIVWNTSGMPDIENQSGNTDGGVGTGDFYSTISGLIPSTSYFVRAYASNEYGHFYGNQIQFTTTPADGTTGTLTDIDGNVYRTVYIGGRDWMAQNLKTTRYRNGLSIDYPGNNNLIWENNVAGAYAWYNNDIVNKDIYGGLYNWYAVNNSNRLCPQGWHVPTDLEWFEMERYVDYFIQDENQIGLRGYTIGQSLKSTTLWYNNGNGLDSYSFTALPGGGRASAGSYATVTQYGYWWTSTESYADEAWGRFLNHDSDYSARYSTPKQDGRSVRCIKDN